MVHTQEVYFETSDRAVFFEVFELAGKIVSKCPWHRGDALGRLGRAGGGKSGDCESMECPSNSQTYHCHIKALVHGYLHTCGFPAGTCFCCLVKSNVFHRDGTFLRNDTFAS